MRRRSRARSGSSSELARGAVGRGAGTPTSVEKDPPAPTPLASSRRGPLQGGHPPQLVEPRVTSTVLRVVAAADGQRDLVAGRLAADRRGQLGGGGDRPVADRGDDVAGLQAGVGRRAVRLRPRRSPRRSRRRSSGRRRRSGRSRPRKARVALPFSMSSLAIRCAVLAGIAKPTPMFPLCDCEPGAPEATVAMARVDADDLAGAVDQRAAGVAGVDRRVGLDGVDDGGVVLGGAGGDGPAGGADDPVGDRVGQPERGADRHRDVADLHLVGVGEGGRGEAARRRRA